MSDTNLKEQNEAIKVDTEKGNFTYPENYEFDAGVGLSEDTVKYISDVKKEPEWVREFRLKTSRTSTSTKFATTSPRGKCPRAHGTTFQTT